MTSSDTSPGTPYSNRPLFGILSVTVPIFGVFFYVLASWFLHSLDKRTSWHHSLIRSLWSLWLWFIPAVLLFGIISSVIAWRRRERWRALSLVNLLINLAALLWLFFTVMTA